MSHNVICDTRISSTTTLFALGQASRGGIGVGWNLGGVDGMVPP